MSARSVHPHSSHWGVFEAEVEDGQVVSVHPYPYDAHPSPILANIPDSIRHPTRISQPMVRAGWLDYGAAPSTFTTRRVRFIASSMVWAATPTQCTATAWAPPRSSFHTSSAITGICWCEQPPGPRL